MGGVPLSFALDSGETLTIARDDLQHVCNLLWGLAPKPGARSTAAMVHVAARHDGRTPFELTALQSTLLRDAVDLLHA
jgi:hypothetical protein